MGEKPQTSENHFPEQGWEFFSFKSKTFTNSTFHCFNLQNLFIREFDRLNLKLSDISPGPQRECQDQAEFVQKVLGPYSLNVTTAARLCSTWLCQGKGRCVRQNPDSPAFLHLPPAPEGATTKATDKVRTSLYPFIPPSIQSKQIESVWPRRPCKCRRLSVRLAIIIGRARGRDDGRGAIYSRLGHKTGTRPAASPKLLCHIVQRYGKTPQVTWPLKPSEDVECLS